MAELTCIGGHNDRKTVYDVGPEVTMAYIVSPSRKHFGLSTETGTERYIKETISTTDGHLFYLYRHEHLTQADVFRKLLEDYTEE